MKILWLINVPLPEASILMNKKPQPFGGWLINASKDLAKHEDVELSIAFPQKGVGEYKQLKGKYITYYAFKPVKEKDKKKICNNIILQSIIKEVKPEFVHIYGTEMAHTFSMINACKLLRIETIISIQGLVSMCSKHTYASLPFYTIYGFTIRNLLRRDSIYGLKKIYALRGKNEIKALKGTNNIIGRTIWDRTCSEQINPEAKYHFCNETLREEFYKHQWNINNSEKYSIFLSQGQHAIKGLHYMLEAMPLILKKFPETKVYIGGKDITKTDTFKDRLLSTYYGKYIQKMIRRLNIEDNVIFIGVLDEKQMCERYLKSHVFVCPSSIENSPNSLGEAMLLGVPCVASYVGGIPDMIKDKEEGFLYQHDAPYMLAHYVCEIFGNDVLAWELSKNAKKRALETHNKDENTRKLIEIYKKTRG